MNEELALELVESLLQDLRSHVLQEGEEVELRNRNGSWEDVRDRVEKIKEALQ